MTRQRLTRLARYFGEHRVLPFGERVTGRSVDHRRKATRCT